MKLIVLKIWLFCICSVVKARIHTATLTDDRRNLVVLSTFGYLKHGSLAVNISLVIPEEVKDAKKIGFTLDKSSSSGTSGYTEKEENAHGCILTAKELTLHDVPRAVFTFVRRNNSWYMEIRRLNLKRLIFDKSIEDFTARKIVMKDDDASEEDKHKTSSRKKAVEMSNYTKRAAETKEAIPEALLVTAETTETGDIKLLSSIFMYIDNVDEEGLYELYFHNCHNSALAYNSDDRSVAVSMTAHIVERNEHSYLSAGDLALPAMYGIMSCIFFMTGVFWFVILCGTKESVFKIHYLMGTLMIVKALSIMFHAIDYYFIGRDGRPEAWAVIFYIVHLLKGILLFICLLLIGTGWAFIKYILSDREKKVFMIVIPLQVIANVAYIIIEGTDEDSKSYSMWKDTMILLDLLCCGAILIPVIWSVRHLQEASQTDGKAAMNLAKLRLFQHFYVMVICYLYFTRIIVYLLEITLPFQFIWIHLFFSEVGTFIFFVVTGYKFRPGCDNPYLVVPQEEDDEVESQALTQSGATETVFKVNQHEKDVLDTDEQDLLLPLRHNQSSLV